MCRLWSTELSSIKPQLDAHNVRLAGVGLEELGLKEFQDGNFFNGGKCSVFNIKLAAKILVLKHKLSFIFQISLWEAAYELWIHTFFYNNQMSWVRFAVLKFWGISISNLFLNCSSVIEEVSTKWYEWYFLVILLNTGTEKFLGLAIF